MEAKQVMVPTVAGVIIKKDGEYLLVQEKKASAYGLWNLPAGHVDEGESIEAAAIRETKEEVGYDVNLIKKVYVGQNSINEPVKLVFYAEIIGGDLSFPENEILNVDWFSLEEIKTMKGELRHNYIIESIEILEQSI